MSGREVRKHMGRWCIAVLPREPQGPLIQEYIYLINQNMKALIKEYIP